MTTTMAALARIPLLASRSSRIANIACASSFCQSSKPFTPTTSKLYASRIFCRSHFGRQVTSLYVRNYSDKALLDDDEIDITSEANSPYHHRIWTPGNQSEIWNQRFIEREDEEALLRKIAEEESGGSRMKSRQLGVLNEDAATDMELLTQNYSAKSLASAVSFHCAC